MEDNIKKEIMKIKSELFEKKEGIRDIETLANKEIDRDLATDFSDFSERELESLLEENISFLNESVDPLPDLTSITSHRKLIGKPIVWIKRGLFKIAGAYFTHILEKQKIFNQRCADSYRILRLHQKKHREKIIRVEEKIAECEVRLGIVSKKMEELEKKTGADSR
jgi:hypothetical protein